jgi:hypothetical protein
VWKKVYHVLGRSGLRKMRIPERGLNFTAQTPTYRRSRMKMDVVWSSAHMLSVTQFTTLAKRSAAISAGLGDLECAHSALSLR